MVFTQSHGLVIGASFGLRRFTLRCRVLVCNAVDTAALATRFLFGKLFCVSTLFDFGEKRYCKNLPLGVSNQMVRAYLLSVACLTFAGWLLYSQSVWLGHAIFIPFCVLIALATWSDLRHRARLRHSRDVLSELPCPSCGEAFGSQAARAAFVPQPRNFGVISDSFGNTGVRCPSCNGNFAYHQLAMSLCSIDYDTLPGLPNKAKADA